MPGRLDGATVLVAVPADIEALRGRDPALARRWRIAVREALAALLADGARIAGFDRAGWYVARGEDAMKLTGVELRRIAMPLVAPFRTSFGTETERDVLLVRVVTDEAEGWGECVAMADPLYSSEYVDGAADVLRRFLVPALAAALDRSTRTRSRRHAGAVQGPPDGQGRAGDGACSTPSCAPQGRSFARELGAVHDRVPCGVSVGIMDSIPALLDAVGGYLAEGYLRIKLKIEPGWDVEPVRAVRERFGDDVLLQVDANTAYTLADARHLARLDPFDLLLIEQPLAEDDILGHAELAS